MEKRNIDNLIIDEFSKLYDHLPIVKITVKQLVDNCHINRATFYRHFKDVYDVRNRIESLFIDNFKRAINKGMAHNKVLYNLPHLFPQVLKDNWLSFDVLFKSPDNFHTVNRLINELVPLYQQEFHTQMKASKSEKIDYLATFYVNGLCAVLIQWTRQGQVTPVNELTDLLTSIYSNGLISILNE